MSVTVWGTFCNSVPNYGLSFYCEGSSACNVFDKLPAVKCQKQTTRTYCTNDYTCKGANFTNDIYIKFPPNSLSATSYDTITRNAYNFKQTISVKSSSGSKAARHDVENEIDNHLEERKSSPPLSSEQVYNGFLNVFDGSKNPGQLLITSLADALFNLESTAKSPTRAELRSDITKSVTLAAKSATNNILSLMKQCREETAAIGGLSPINSGSIASITNSVKQTTFATWLLTMSIIHIIANIALVSEIDVAQRMLQQSSGLICTSSTSKTTTSKTTEKVSTGSASIFIPTTVHTSTTKTTKSSSSSTSHSTQLASISSKTTSSISRSTTASSTKKTTTSSVTTSSSPESQQASSSTSPDLPVSTSLSLEAPAVQAPNDFKPGYVSNSTESEELGGTVTFFDTVNSALSYVQYTTQNDSFLFTVGTPDLLCLSTPDGEGLIMSLDGTTMTYFAAGGLNQQSYTIPITSVSDSTRRKVKRQGSQLPVTVDLYDSCNNPSTDANIIVNCTPLLYAQTNAAAGTVPGQTVPGILSGNGAGEYTGSCDTDSILSSNQMYQQCVTQSQHNLNVFCGLDQEVANDVKGFFENLQKNVKKISEGVEVVSKAVFEALEDFQTKVGDLIEKVNPAFDFYENFCDFVQDPIIVAEFDEEDCGYPSQMSVGIQGLGFNVPLGAFSATAGAMVSTQVIIPASTACTTTSSSSASASSSSSASDTSTSSTSTASSTPSPTPALYSDQSGNCTPFQAYGKAVFCCSGGCLDGTSIGSPGQCEYWTDVCGDVDDGAPLCGADQVLQGGNDGDWVASGDGNCWGGDECQWAKNNWTWSCCDCPTGYTNVLLGACEGSSDVPGACVGCLDPGQTLSGNATSGFMCT